MGDRARFRGDLSKGRGTDLQIPTNEIAALESVIAELDLQGKSYRETLDTIDEFFSTKFTYRMWQDADNGDNPTNSPLTRFLLKTRAGHCEYFATATVLLLRELGIPARYAVGYSVHEAQWSGYVVRQSDAHAWCLVWNENKRLWEDFDTTPGNGIEEHHSRASLWMADAWWWAHFQLSKIRWGQTHLRNYILMGLVPVLALLLFQIVRQRRRLHGKDSLARRDWPGLDSEFYQIEKQLAARGVLRGANETLADWLERAAVEPSLSTLKAPLRGLLRLHYRYRFDPQGLSDSDRQELRREAGECLDKLAQLEKTAAA
jgi:transglutaminase-like putative cysteine protease